MAQITGRCMKCKEPREFEVADRAVMKNGAVRLWGPCPVCGTNVNTIMSAAKAAELS
jgi:uncharacterized protein DUF5679